jgi:hypothetical protein
MVATKEMAGKKGRRKKKAGKKKPRKMPSQA